jgi:hypothetical protein
MDRKEHEPFFKFEEPGRGDAAEILEVMYPVDPCFLSADYELGISQPELPELPDVDDVRRVRFYISGD